MESPLEMPRVDRDVTLHSLGRWLCFEWGFGAGVLQRSLAIEIIQ